MPLYTADALILRTYQLGEADRIVVFLTRDRGKKRGVAKGARRVRSRFLGALEPLTEARVAYFEKERRELVGLNFAEPIRSPLALTGPAKAGHSVREGAEAGHYVREGHALGYVGYFAELLDEWAQEADADERLYRLGASMLSALASGAPVEPLARYFEYWLLRLQGVYPEARGRLSAGAAAFLEASRAVAPERIGDVPAGQVPEHQALADRAAALPPSLLEHPGEGRPIRVVPRPGVDGRVGSELFGNRPGSFARAGDPIFLNYATGNITTRMRALLQEGRGRVVQAPIIRTLNNQPAFVVQFVNTVIFINQIISTGQQVIVAPVPQILPIQTGIAVAPRINDDGTITNWLGNANGGYTGNIANAENHVDDSWLVQPNPSGAGEWDVV